MLPDSVFDLRTYDDYYRNDNNNIMLTSTVLIL